jgi:thioredoxin-like negative regulator of GroEL
MGVAWACFFGGRHEEALQEGRRTREIAPGFEEAGNVMISAYEELGRYQEAAAIMRAQRCYGIQFDGDAMIAALRSGGERAYWRTRLEQLAQPASTATHAVHLASAIAHVHLGEADAALDHLEAMVDNHLAGAVFVAVNPCLVSLRGHPRYEAVVKKLGVPLRRGASAPHTVST